MIRTRTLMAVSLLIVASQGIHAQSASSVGRQGGTAAGALDSRWSAWLGCWRPSGRSGGADSLQLCIVPTADGAGVKRITFAGDREVLAETIVADGAPQRSSEKDCAVTRQSRWAKSSARLFLSSTLSCPNQPEVGNSGLSALIGADQWLDVQVIKSRGRTEQTRVQRFWRSTEAPPSPVASEVSALISVRPRLPRVSVEDVIEASDAVAPSAVEAWLSEGDIRVPVARRELVQLFAAHVHGEVIDLMVALYYPKKFEVRRASGVGGGGTGIGMFSDFYPGQWGFLSSEYGLGYGAYGVPFFFSANGYYPPGDFYFVPGSGVSTPEQDAGHGQVVNGQGYTRVQTREPYRGVATTSGGSGQSSSSPGASADSGGAGSSSAGSSGSSGVSSGGYSGGGGSSTGLTAVPR